MTKADRLEALTLDGFRVERNLFRENIQQRLVIKPSTSKMSSQASPRFVQCKLCFVGLLTFLGRTGSLGWDLNKGLNSQRSHTRSLASNFTILAATLKTHEV